MRHGFICMTSSTRKKATDQGQLGCRQQEPSHPCFNAKRLKSMATLANRILSLGLVYLHTSWKASITFSVLNQGGVGSKSRVLSKQQTAGVVCASVRACPRCELEMFTLSILGALSATDSRGSCACPYQELVQCSQPSFLIFWVIFGNY